MKIKDNELLRQFETTTSDGILIMEYAIQERKLFLTKLHHTMLASDDEINIFIETILKIALERRQKVVPTHPKIVNFFRKNSAYKEMLPPGIKL
jgi:hypothetical protein